MVFLVGILGVLVILEPFCHVIRIEFPTSTTIIEEEIVQVLNYLRTGATGVSDVRVVLSERGNEFFPHLRKFVSARNDFSVELNEAVTGSQDFVTAPKRDIGEQHWFIFLLILAGVRLCIIL